MFRGRGQHRWHGLAPPTACRPLAPRAALLRRQPPLGVFYHALVDGSGLALGRSHLRCADLAAGVRASPVEPQRVPPRPAAVGSRTANGGLGTRAPAIGVNGGCVLAARRGVGDVVDVPCFGGLHDCSSRGARTRVLSGGSARAPADQVGDLRLLRVMAAEPLRCGGLGAIMDFAIAERRPRMGTTHSSLFISFHRRRCPSVCWWPSPSTSY